MTDVRNSARTMEQLAPRRPETSMKFSEVVEQGIYPTISTFSGTLKIEGCGANSDNTYWLQAAWPNGDYRLYKNVSPDWEITIA